MKAEVFEKMAELDVPEEFVRESGKLEYTGIALVSFGIKNSYLNQLWFYIYDSDIMAARASMPSVK